MSFPEIGYRFRERPDVRVLLYGHQVSVPFAVTGIMVSMADGSAARPGVTARVFGSFSEHDRADAEYWAGMSADVRVMQAWKLSLEQWQLQGHPPHEPGLCRSVAIVRRP